MSILMQKFQTAHMRNDLPDFRPGDVVRVREKVREGEKERTAMFEGLVIARKHGKGLDATFTVRRVSGGIGVERTFPLHLPAIQKIEIVKRTKVRRAKLYYVRHQLGKKVRRRKEADISFRNISRRGSETTEDLAVPETKMVKQTGIPSESLRGAQSVAMGDAAIS